MLINIHTHSRTAKENQLEIVIGEDTVGVHPWDVDKIPDFRKARDYCLMVGETGLDRSEKYKHTLDVQIRFLRAHLATALHFKIPIVLHCVRAQSDLLHILKDMRYNGKVLLHDFAGNAQHLEAYLNFDVYFSFRRNFEILKIAPIDRIFLETDDQTQFSIADIYHQSEIPEAQLEKNFLCFFSDAQNEGSTDVINYLRIALSAH